MSFTVPSRDSLHSEGIADYAASQPDKSVAKGSYPFALIRAVSGLLWSVAAKLLFFDKIRLPDTADEENLQRWGVVFSFPSLGAVGAYRALGLRVSGTAGATVTTGAQLTHSDGTIYQVTSVGFVIGVGGTVVVDIAAVSKGLATNKVAGESLTFTSPPVNVTSVAVLVLDLKNGTDREALEPYRARFLAHLGDPPEGGNIPNYLEWALQVPGNASAYVWRNRRGQGTIDVAVLGSGHGAQRVITDTTATQTYLDDTSRRPGNVKNVQVLTTSPVTTPVKGVITIDTTKYKWDFTDNGTGYLVTAINSGASTITVPTMPAAVVAGVRITVNGEEAIVTLVAGTVYTLAFAPDVDGNVVTWFTATPLSGMVRASGDLVTPVRRAILALFDRLGPARDVRYSQTQWESSLQTDSIITAARNVLGCTKYTAITPTVDVAATDPLNGSITVPFLVPGNVEIVMS